MIEKFLEKARSGQSVYLHEVREAFASAGHALECSLEPGVGAARAYRIAFPEPGSAAELAFIKEYVYAHIYNLVSVLGGKRMTLYTEPGDTLARELCASLEEAFQTGLPRAGRRGYGKCLNVADRANAALGLPPFHFALANGRAPAQAPKDGPKTAALHRFQGAVQRAGTGLLCGMDIGGTDIKLVAVRDGRIAACKEYDWNPSLLTRAEAMIEPLLLLLRVMRLALSLGEEGRQGELKRAMLAGNASDGDMLAAAAAAEAEFGAPPLLDGIGVCFPDVVIEDRIVGGETLKTKGMREHSPDYEGEFAKLTGLKALLEAHCRPGGAVRLSNDGSLAAYTAALELAHSSQAEAVAAGVFAHTLGTELGTGWIDESGEIPSLPLEVYNCIIDMGEYPARAFEPLDIRSLHNFNTALPGTLQKYCSQSGAYRLALEYFRAEAPARCQELFDQGFLVEREGGIYVAADPRDMRKPLLEHIMGLASQGEPAAEKVFRKIGEYLAVTAKETEFILAPKALERVLFGRFVKKQRCFELMREGALAVSGPPLVAAGDELAYTPLMRQLQADRTYTVAQFGQAVGAAYYAASGLA